MTPETLKNAIIEAQRFLKLAKAVPLMKINGRIYIETGKATGACRRASMDLSRALSELRR